VSSARPSFIAVLWARGSSSAAAHQSNQRWRTGVTTLPDESGNRVAALKRRMERLQNFPVLHAMDCASFALHTATTKI
jgi:predicted nucleic acid-binding Zn ribbon protein